jgi:hypothetical protein
LTASQANDWSLVSMTFIRFRRLIGQVPATPGQSN